MQISFAFGIPASIVSAVIAFSSIQGGTPAPASGTQTAPAQAAATTFKVDGVHSCALFRVHHAGAGQFWGRFNNVTGTFTGGSAKPDGMAFDISIDVASVDTRTKKLDQHLLSPDFFNVAEFPNMTFKSTGVKARSGNMLDVTGDLTLLGVTKSITATMEFTGAMASAAGNRAGYEATFTIKRSEFGMKYGVEQGMLGDDVRIIVNLEGEKK